MKDIVQTELSKKIHSTFTIGEIRFTPFNSLELYNVYVEDLSGDTLLFANKLSTHVDLVPLLKNKLVIKDVLLSDFTVNINQDSASSPMNFQFIIDAFASKDTTPKPPSSLVIAIDDIRISNGKIRYDVKSMPETPGVFNVNHIEADSLFAELSLKSIDIKKLDAKLNNLSFKEKSGLNIQNITLFANSSGEIINLETIKIALPHSQLTASGKIDYTGMELSSIMNKGKIELSIDKSFIQLADIKNLAPTLSNFTDSLQINGKINAEFPSINLQDLHLSLNENVSLDADASISDYANFEKSKLSISNMDLSINEKGIQSIVQNFTGERMILPEQVSQLGNIRLKGKAHGVLDNMDLNLDVQTAPGNVQLNGLAGYNLASGTTSFDAQIQSSNFLLKDLLKDDQFGKMSLQANVKGSISSQNFMADINGTIPQFDYSGHSYSNITIDASAKQNMYTANLKMNDPFGKLTLNASADLSKKLPAIKATLSAKNVLLDKLNLLPGYPDSNLSLALEADIQGDNLDNITGNIKVDSLLFLTEKQRFETTTPLTIIAGFEDNEDRKLSLTSDILNGEISGKISFSTLSMYIQNSLNEYFPSIFSTQNKIIKPGENNFTATITCKNTDKLTQIFDLPFTLMKESSIHISLNDMNNDIECLGNFPQLNAGGTLFNDIVLNISNKQGPLNLSLKGNMPDKENIPLLFELSGVTMHDSTSLNLNFDNPKSDFRLKGDIHLTALFSRLSEKLPLKITMAIHPSNVNVNNLALRIPSSTINIEDDKFIINKFRIEQTSDEYIQANGIYSSTGTDTLAVNINKINLNTIAKTIGLDLNIGGLADGKIDISGTTGNPNIFTKKFSINNITLNNDIIGNLITDSDWDSNKGGIALKSILERTNNDNSTIEGNIYPLKDSLNINVDLKDFEVAWLQPFLKGTLHDLGGNISSVLTVKGKLSDPYINGFIYADNTRFGIDFTNVTYSLSDTIAISPTRLDIRNLAIKDSNGKTAYIDCKVNHQNFKNLSYDLSMKMNDFLVLNTMEKKDSLFYGLVKLSGNINASGTDAGVKVGLRLQNSSDSKIAVILPSNTTATEYKSLVFLDKRTEEEKKEQEEEKKPDSTFPIDLNMTLNITPDMLFTVFLDPSMTDNASVNGTGNIRMNYNMATSAMNIFGDYTISKGDCVISLKGISKKKFTINEGSKVIFNGDPMKAKFDITAYYAVKADLGTLDQSFTTDMRTSRTNVHCVLNIKGNMDKMDISYDIQLPDLSDDIEQKMKSYINNNDIMIREFAYLLALGSFYAPDYATAAKSNNSLWSSVASSTLSSTLNGLVSGVLGKNWTIGTNINSAQGDASELEMDISVSTQLFNNRLILNTNLGYDNTNTTTNSNFIGDFDAELKLNRSGSLRLKAYNKTNDQYYEKSPTTQGVGFVYTKESRFFKNLFKPQKQKK